MPILKSLIKNAGLILIMWIQLLAYSVFKEDDEGIDLSLWTIVGYSAVLVILMSIQVLI